MAHPQIVRALRLMNMEKNGMPTVAEFEALLTDAGRLDACIGLLQRPGAGGQITGYPNLAQALAGTDAGMALALSNASIMAAVAQRPSAMLAFINDQSALDTIFSQPDVRAAFLAGTALAKASVPKMTSATAPSGVVSASDLGGGNPPWLAFDGKSETFWNGSAGAGWIQYEFPSAVFICEMTLESYGLAWSPKLCAIQKSTDGVVFETVKSFDLASAVHNTLSFAKTGFARYWRFAIQTYHGGGSNAYKRLNFTGFISP